MICVGGRSGKKNFTIVECSDRDFTQSSFVMEAGFGRAKEEASKLIWIHKRFSFS
jgi:hypothetical protein